LKARLSGKRRSELHAEVGRANACPERTLTGCHRLHQHPGREDAALGGIDRLRRNPSFLTSVPVHHGSERNHQRNHKDPPGRAAAHSDHRRRPRTHILISQQVLRFLLKSAFPSLSPTPPITQSPHKLHDFHRTEPHPLTSPSRRENPVQPLTMRGQADSERKPPHSLLPSLNQQTHPAGLHQIIRASVG